MTNEEAKEIKKEIKALNKKGSELSEIIWCGWDSTSEERMVAVVKELAELAKEISKLETELEK